MINIFTIT